MTAEHCPGRSELAAFSQGTLDEISAGRVSCHLEECQKCTFELCMLSCGGSEFEVQLRECASSQFLHESAFRLGIQELLCRGERSATGGLGCRSGQPDDLTGMTLRDYRLLEKLGQGGMGRVYKAVHERLDRVVAVKTVHCFDDRDSGRRLERFQREIKAIGRLNHASVRTFGNWSRGCSPNLPTTGFSRSGS